jgi:hypothetical protein
MEKQMTINDFYNKYTTQYNQVELKKFQAKENTSGLSPDDMCSFGGCMYETFGEELDCIIAMLHTEADTKHIWTIVDTDGDDLIILAGFHIINRLGYLITDEPWEDEYEEYIVD